MITSLEKTILDALLELEETVKVYPVINPKPNLAAMFSRLDELTAQLPPQTDARLLHYLRKKSYQKARLFLQGREDENLRGNCVHV
jgi:hypothetical protein